MLTTPCCLPTAARRGGGLHEVGDVEHRLAEELVAALRVDLHQAALDRADARRADVAVAGLVLRRVVGDVLQHRAQVLEVEQEQAVVVGDLEDELETPSCVSLRSSMRASSSGPMSLTVARTGWPEAALSSANTSHSVAGHAAGGGGSMPRSFRIAAIFGLTLPGWVMPVRSPLTSAMNTGTPWRLKFLGERLQRHRLAGAGGAVTRPWRLAIAGRGSIRYRRGGQGGSVRP
jgi:hypothetical protein